MKYTAYIKNNETGEIRESIGDVGNSIEGLEFIWSEGNFSCSCNREIFFEYVKGIEVESPVCHSKKI